MEKSVEDKVKPFAVHVVQMVSHAGDMYVLLSDGSLHQRVRNPKNFNQGPAESEPAFFWRKLDTPKV